MDQSDHEKGETGAIGIRNINLVPRKKHIRKTKSYMRKIAQRKLKLPRRKSSELIPNVYKNTIEEGLDHGGYQLLNTLLNNHK